MHKAGLVCLAALLLLVQAAGAQAETAVSVSPCCSGTGPGDSFTITVNISTTDPVYAFDISVHYDPGIISALQAGEGGFLKGDGTSTFIGTNTIDNVLGRVRIAVSRFGTQDGITGEGDLLEIDFNASGTGTSPIGLGNVQIVDNGPDMLEHEATNGSARVNIPPVIWAVAAGPGQARTGDALDCGFEVSDPDDQDTVMVDITWLRNGGAWTQDDENGMAAASWGNTSPQGDIEPGDTAKGDTWVCRATAYDGISSVTRDSSPLTIQNSPPELFPIGDKEILENQTLRFNVSAADDDSSDTLAYGTDAGFGDFNPDTGEFSWTPGWDDAGSYTVMFNVTDGTDTQEEAITIRVNDSNRAPVIDYYSPVSLFLATRTGRALVFAHVSSDPDPGDALTYSWKLNGTWMSGSQNWTFSPPECGDREVMLAVSDSHGQASMSWSISVKLSGDVDLDRDVDISDLVAAGLAYGSRPGEGNWNPRADLYTLAEGGQEGDGVIDIFDLAAVGLNYGNGC